MCCGKQRLTFQEPVAAVAPPPVVASLGVMFEYKGATALTVVSPLTGKMYKFASPGARMAVDARDTPWLSFVPNVRRV